MMTREPRTIAEFVAEAMELPGSDTPRSSSFPNAADLEGAHPFEVGRDRVGPFPRSRELDVAGRITFVGLVADERLPEYYAAADVFCMPCTTRYGGLDTEGFGVVYLEAQASGIPCIAGRCGGSAEAVEDGVSGFVVDDPTPQKVARALVDLRRDRALAARLGGAGRSRVEREFAPEVAAARLEDAVGSLSD